MHVVLKMDRTIPGRKCQTIPAITINARTAVRSGEGGGEPAAILATLDLRYERGSWTSVGKAMLLYLSWDGHQKLTLRIHIIRIHILICNLPKRICRYSSKFVPLVARGLWAYSASSTIFLLAHSLQVTIKTNLESLAELKHQAPN